MFPDSLYLPFHVTFCWAEMPRRLFLFSGHCSKLQLLRCLGAATFNHTLRLWRAPRSSLLAKAIALREISFCLGLHMPRTAKVLKCSSRISRIFEAHHAFPNLSQASAVFHNVLGHGKQQMIIYLFYVGVGLLSDYSGCLVSFYFTFFIFFSYRSFSQVQITVCMRSLCFTQWEGFWRSP